MFSFECSVFRNHRNRGLNHGVTESTQVNCRKPGLFLTQRKKTNQIHPSAYSATSAFHSLRSLLCEFALCSLSPLWFKTHSRDSLVIKAWSLCILVIP